MARKVVLDMDPGIDDAMALCLALLEPELEVVAVTATGGNVPPDQATQNVQALVDCLDPPLRPRVGAASSDQILRTDGRRLHGANGLAGVDLPIADLHHQHSAIKVLSDAVRFSQEPVTIVATGPLTNLATVLQAEPDLATLIGHLIILGGTLGGPGDVTAAAEFNIYCDAISARKVFHSRVTTTLIPLDISRQVVLTYDLLNNLPEAPSRHGSLLRQILPSLFRFYHERVGLEGIYVDAAVAVALACHPDLYEARPLYGDVETDGALTHGMTVFDRRQTPEHSPNMDVVVEIDAAKVTETIVRRLTG
jgi:purine nucleosidase